MSGVIDIGSDSCQLKSFNQLLSPEASIGVPGNEHGPMSRKTAEAVAPTKARASNVPP